MDLDFIACIALTIFSALQTFAPLADWLRFYRLCRADVFKMVELLSDTNTNTPHPRLLPLRPPPLCPRST